VLFCDICTKLHRGARKTDEALSGRRARKERQRDHLALAPTARLSITISLSQLLEAAKLINELILKLKQIDVYGTRAQSAVLPSRSACQ